MAAPTGPKILAAKGDTPYLEMIAFNTAATGDADFTNTSGVTHGYCARAIYATGNGNIAFWPLGAPGLGGVVPTPTVRVVTVGDKSTLPVAVAQVDNTNTTATGLFAML